MRRFVFVSILAVLLCHTWGYYLNSELGKETDGPNDNVVGTCGGYPCLAGSVGCKRLVKSTRDKKWLTEKIFCLGNDRKEINATIIRRENPTGGAVFVLQYASLDETFEGIPEDL